MTAKEKLPTPTNWLLNVKGYKIGDTFSVGYTALLISEYTKQLTEQRNEARGERDKAKRELKELWDALEDPEKCGELLAGM